MLKSCIPDMILEKKNVLVIDPLRKKGLFFGAFFLFVEKVLTVIKLEGGGRGEGLNGTDIKKIFFLRLLRKKEKMDSLVLLGFV